MFCRSGSCCITRMGKIMLYKFTFLLSIVAILISCNTNPPTSSDDTTQKFGKALITSNILDAEIWIDNINTGQLTPDTIQTTLGNHTLTLKKTDYLDASKIIEIVKDSLISIDIIMTEVTETGKIFISSEPDGAQIFLDQVNTGKVTPDTITTSPGTHQIELQRAFYYSLDQQVEVVKDSVLLIDVVLQETPPLNIVLIEDFANVSCVPCVTSNKIIESLTNVRYGHSKLVAIKYPTNFPSPNDPFYLANTGDCNARIGYYNIFSAPTTIVDGFLRPISTDSISIIAAVDQRLTKEIKFRIDVASNIVGSQYFTTITIKVLDGGGIDFPNLVLHTVLTETDIEFATPPGSNGETKFFDVMRVMLPSNTGQSLNGISQTEEVVFEYQTPISSSWVVENLNIIAFIQNKNTKEVYQAGSTFD